MARAHFVKAARKPIKEAGVKVGESYWWWKFRRGPKRVSKTRPRPSQLTNSDYLSQFRGLVERIEDLTADESLAGEVEGIAEEFRALGEEQEEKRGNMPDSLQDSETGELLQARADACSAAADELEGLDLGAFEAEAHACVKEVCDEPCRLAEEEHNAEGQTEQEYWEERLQEVQGVSLSEE